MVRVRAPEFPDRPWINCDALSLKSLRGRPVLLDFWTYGCINCLHILPDLQFLEAKYGDLLVVIGVHSAKFEAEKSLSGIQQAIERYDVHHPVLVDSDRTVWDAYAVRAYPTFVLIDPQGYITLTLSGEGHRERLDRAIQTLLGEVNSESLEPSLSQLKDFTDPTPLRFPGKVLADEVSDRLFIADTGHHRIVIADLQGQVQQTIGTGQAGWQDGEGPLAQFNQPQGMTIDPMGQTLYVADTGNHLLRSVDLRSGVVQTIAGTGIQSRIWAPHGGKARSVALNSPWDLIYDATDRDPKLLIAMAGSHQIWTLDLQTAHLQTLAGTGAEGCFDGSAIVAAFAQPMGLASNGRQVFSADCESSSIRVLAWNPDAVRSDPLDVTVRTLCGAGNLYDFGDRDGQGEQARLQHCSGLTYAQGWLWVADSYNHKIKRIDPKTGDCTTTIDGLAEPMGLSATATHLYIANTNQHQILKFDRTTQKITPLELTGLCPPGSCPA